MASTVVRYLEGSRVRLFLPEGATHPRIELEDEQSILAGRVRRVFPLSHSDGYFSIQDGSGKDVGVLRSLDELDSESRELLEAELARRYFTPTIQSIDSLRQDGGMWLFRVQTQRGPAQFYVRNWRDSSHEISHMRFQIVSVDGQRFEIRDYTALDERSQALLDQLF
jgi:hypothetical protein